jgi:hypothetical protein
MTTTTAINSASTPLHSPTKPLHIESGAKRRPLSYGLIPHPDDIKEPEIGAAVDAYFMVSVGQAVGLFYSW